MEASKDIKKYFDEIDEKVKLAYSIANKAKSKGYDVDKIVDIPLAKNMAERVEGIISIVAPQIRNSGMVERIAELEDKYGKLDWRVALVIAEEVAREKFCKFKNKLEAIEVGIRVGLAYVTIGVVSSPLEGFIRLDLKKRRDGKDYFCLYYSGPIRSAGGTAASVSLLIADYLRNKFGYERYDPTNDEVQRMIVEMYDYHERITNLQYLPTEEEAEFLLSNLPVQIDGDPTEEMEVSNYKDLSRIDTNRLRGGPCLVVAEGISQKAPKLWKQLSKWGKDFGLDDWNFLEEFINIQKKLKSKSVSISDIKNINPDHTYITDLVGGRPVLTYPLRKGGFRLRYGRGRNSGLSSTCIHPASMSILNDYIAIGTQLKLERPGKSTALGVCDTIEGPIVKLNNGDVLFLDTEEEAKNYSDNIKEILFLGDILINYGDFLNRVHVLVPVGYCEEWWLQEVKKADSKFKADTKISFDKALEISKRLNVPIHPRYTYHWADISKEDFFRLINWVSKGKIDSNKIVLPITEDNPKRVLELLGIPHNIFLNEGIVISGDWASAFLCSLGLLNKKIDLKKINNLIQSKEDVLDIINSISDVRIRDKSGTFIGARMGRPEKAKMRKLIGSPQVLFPVGDSGGRLRAFNATLEIGKISGDFPLYFCKNCNKETIYSVCENCDNLTKEVFYCNECKRVLDSNKCNIHGEAVNYDFKEIDIRHYFEKAVSKLGIDEIPQLIKGVRGTSSKNHAIENLIKGILRAMYNLYVNRDGTIRYDITELPITAFKPKEIGTSIERLKELGYNKDINGEDLISKEQILELKPQDVILPSCESSPDEGADIVLGRVANFIDDLLVKFYNEKRFYNLRDKRDLVGHFVVALAPHISAGIVGRIIGFSKTQGLYAHPLFHCACRRDADGDELSVILLLDVLLNFSKQYLPSHRGAVQDAPIVLTSNLVASEVDDMVFDMDVVNEYPLELYEAALNYKQPSEVKIEKLKERLGTEKQYMNFGFTHDTSDINVGVKCSAYKFLPTMKEKVFGQMAIAERIRAVDQDDVARLIIERHFLRDILGNLRKFSTQEFRCVKCNEKFRRPPLAGVCKKCNGKIIFTVSEGTVTKYLQPTISLANKYNLSPFLKQTLELTKRRIESVFGVEKERQEGLGKWFG